MSWEASARHPAADASTRRIQDTPRCNPLRPDSRCERWDTIRRVSEGAFTFASQGYLAAATALGRSFVATHPRAHFHVVTVGELRSPLPRVPGIEFLPESGLRLPGGGRFRFRYPVKALCAALKPFAFMHLFEAVGTDRLLYLDADMLVLRPMSEAWALLDHAHAMLVPALPGLPAPEPAPALRTALLRGAFDTSVVGLRRGASTARLLDWWARQVYVDCIDAPADGLYLDRRFMDLVPGAFPGTGILRHGGFNADPWTLGDRGEGDGETNADAGLACFHFRGYQPERPRVFTGAPGAVDAADRPVLAELATRYARELSSPGMPADERRLPQRLVLGNGVVACRSLAAVELQVARRQLRCPAPDSDPDGFCRYATQSDPRAFGSRVAPLVSALLRLRPDVAAAYPQAATRRDDPGFLRWLYTCGVDEEQVGSLLEAFGQNLAREHPVRCALASHPGAPGLRAAAVYLPGGIDAAVARILDGYFSDAALRTAIPLLHDDRSVAALAAAMTTRLVEFPAVGEGDLIAFERASEHCRDALLLACLRYNPAVRRRIGGGPSVFRRDEILALLRDQECAAAWPVVEAALFDPEYAPPVAQLDDIVAAEPALASMFPEARRDTTAAREQAQYILDAYAPASDQPGVAAWSRLALEGVERGQTFGVNLCGLLRDASGMGELARAYARSLDQAGLPYAQAVLPGRVPASLDENVDPRHRYGGLDPRYPVKLVVANPHSRAFVDAWLEEGRSPAPLNLAAWAWETERMPAHFARASAGLDAIVSISRFSADAIAASVACPVHVVHPSPDFHALARATPDRERFGLPHEMLLFGFFFDAYSVLERKNPSGLLDAFRAAFEGRTDVGLVLKVNSPNAGGYDLALLKQRAPGLNVFWIDERLSQAGTYDLMASLDAYVSLHRAEGFGLTMAEAMVLGKPVVATGYSGNLDFMDADSALLVDYDVVTTRQAHGAYPAGSRWAQPSIAHCADLMLALEDSSLRHRVGTAGSRKVRATLDPAGAGRRIEALCRGMLAAK